MSAGSRGRGSWRFRHRSRSCSSLKPIANALAFGAMERDNGPALVTASVSVLGCALTAASINAFARQACYAAA